MCHHQPEAAWDERFEFEGEADREESAVETESDERLEDEPVPTPSD